MQSHSDDTFQIATLVVATLAVVVVAFYLFIFLNPRVAFNPFKPPVSPTTIAIVQTLPLTWTPTPSPTQTWTPTVTPTFTPTSTATPIPTNVSTNVPSATARPPTRTPASTSAPPTPIPSRYAYATRLHCEHSGGTYIKGVVTSGGQPQDGIRVRYGTGPDVATVVEEQFTRGGGEYSFTLLAIGAFPNPSVWYLWLVDGAGNPLSEPNFHFQMNNFPPDNPAACWLAFVDFTK